MKRIQQFLIGHHTDLWQWIIIHHSATADGVTNNWEAIRRYHMKTLGWDNIGYHFGIELEGNRYVTKIGRDLNTPGAHSGIKNVRNGTMFNYYGIGICLVGNYDTAKPEGEGLDRLVYLTRLLMATYDIPKRCVLGHREIFTYYRMEPYKTCPGKMFDMYDFRNRL